MCGERFHEDFGDEPSVEERYPDQFTPDEREEYERWLDDQDQLDIDDDMIDDMGDEAEELRRDEILERQELEDFEGFSPFDDFNDGGDW